MPGFTVALQGTFATRVWTDPASVDRPSRIAPTDLQQHLHARMSPGTIQLRATLDGESGPVDDATGGAFQTWAPEYGSAYEPQQTIPTPGTSAIVDVALDSVGHYTIVMEHKANFGSPPTRGKGKVFVHVDVETTP